MKLNQIATGQTLAGVELDQIVTVVAAVAHGDSAVQLIYRTPDGSIKERLLGPTDEQQINSATVERPFAFDGNGENFKLTCEAKRIDLAFLFDPMMAVHTSNVEPLPHQITAVYEFLLPRQPLRFLLADDPGAGKLCQCASLDPIVAPVAATLQQLLQTHDYVGLCLLLADQLRAANAERAADAFLTIACSGWVATASHNEALRHRAACFLRKGEYAIALELAELLASQNPDDIPLHIFVAQVLASTPGAKDAAEKKTAAIRAHYKLLKPHEDALQQIDEYLSAVA